MSLAARDTRYARFLGWAALAVVVLLVLGYLPTRRLGGERAVLAMLVGCAIGWVSAAMGGWPLLRAARRTPHERLQGMLFAMGLRIFALLALSVPTLIAFDFDRRSLLLWLAVCYCALLALEVRFALSDGTR